MQQIIVNLIQKLRRFDAEVSTEEVLDWLWFTAHFKLNLESEKPLQEIKKSPITEDHQLPETGIPTEQDPQMFKDEQPFKTETSVDLYLPTRQYQSDKVDTSQGGLPFRTPGGRALPHALDISRALRPLVQRIPSPEQFVLDEEATAQHIAESNVWLPVLKPQSMRWLELALVVDGSPSMHLWHHTIKEFRQLLEQQGAFRDVRVWILKTGGRDQKVNLYNELGKTPRHYKELINPARKRLILVVTDCISPAWQSKTLIHWLDTWGQGHSLALVNLLPQQLWPQTRLRTARLVKLSTPGSATPNHYLRVQRSMQPWLKKPDNESCPIPLTTLEPDFLTGWAKFVAGSSNIIMPGFILQPKEVILPDTPLTEADATERLHRFRAVASPTAFKLACFFAAIPLRLPVMRLVQRVMLPESQQIHLAEFFLSGLIKRIKPGEEIENPDEIEYDFVDDSLQDKLLDAGLITDAVQVLEVVSDYITEHYGSTIDFQGIITNPEGFSGIRLTAGQERFAKVAAKVLRRLGGKYLLASNYIKNLKHIESNSKTIIQFNTLQMRQQLDELQEQWRETLEIYGRMKRFIELDDKQREYYDAKSSWIERLKNERFPIAFLGTFSSGKSTIINALIAKDILPETVKSFTVIPTLIKSSDKNDKAIVCYLSEDQKNELKTILLEEITNKFGKNIADYNKLNKDDLIQKLKNEIEKLPNYETFDPRLFDELKQLLEKWDKSKAGEIKEIPLTELHKYVTEDYEDVLLVDKCEVYLKNIDMPEDLILVDLPGLGVVNPRHKKVTQDYVAKNAKAFVVCMMPLQLLEGKEIQTLEEIQNANPRILQKAFWVVNQWDKLSDQQKSEEKDNFQNKVREKKFDIDQDRVFYVSALNYLLLKAVIEGWLDATIKLKSHIKNIHAINAGLLPDADKAKELLEINPDVSTFGSFKTSLFDYMNKKAKKEFIQDAQVELLKFIRELTNTLAPLYILAPLYEEESGTGEKLEARLQSKYLVQKLETYSKKVQEIIENEIRKIRIETPGNKIAWTEQQRNRVVSIIEERIKKIDKMNKIDLKNQLMKSEDIGIYMSRLLERLIFLVPVSNILREEVNDYFMKTIIDKLCQTLRLKLIGLQQALPNKAKEELELRLNGRDFAMRLRGLNDYIFYGYGRKVEIGLTEAILTLLDKKDDNLTEKDIDNLIDMVIEKFKKIAIDFIDETVAKINIYYGSCVRNFVEDLEKELLELFTSYKDNIASKLDLEIKRGDTQLSREIEKQRFINASYKRLKELESTVYQ